MSELFKLPSKLRGIADEVEGMRKDLLQVPKGTTIVEAFQKLAAFMSEVELTIAIRKNKYSKGVEVEYTVWDGNKHHKCNCLDGCMVAIAVKNQPEEGLDGLKKVLPESEVQQ